MAVSEAGETVSAPKKVTSGLRRQFMKLAGGETLTRTIAAMSRPGRLRVLGYHDVPEPAPFERHLQHLAMHWAPVSAKQVIASWREDNFPRRAVWVTFDDGYPGVIKHALPLLRQYGVPATLFVCPGYIDTDKLFWWEVIERASTKGLARSPHGNRWTTVEALTVAKSMPDGERRAFVDGLANKLSTHDDLVPRRQLTTADLYAWSAAGLELGNHTYDHPCLHRCAPSEQERQIREAHHWLAERFPSAPWVFAYPNGNATAVAENLLQALGYRIALGFDHRVARIGHRPLRLSRLRIDATAEVERFCAIVSGIHPAAYGLTPQARRPSERLRRV